eukprot:837551_1
MAQPNNYQSQFKKSKRKRKKNKKYNQYQQKQEYHKQPYTDQKQSSTSKSSSNEDLLIIDGSTMEGGGQILRNSFAFAALMKKSIKINKIRGKRSTPGLRKQH